MKKEHYLKLWESQEDNPKVYQALWFDLLNASGWAGVLPNGNIVDRRYFPEATPVQENSLFGVNKPKEVETEDHLPLEHRLYNFVNDKYDYIFAEIYNYIEAGNKIELDKVEVPMFIIIKDSNAILGAYQKHFRVIVSLSERTILEIRYHVGKVPTTLIWGELKTKYGDT